MASRWLYLVAVAVIFSTPSLARAEGLHDNARAWKDLTYDWTYFEPRLGARLDLGQANKSGYSLGPQAGIRGGIYKDDYYAGLEFDLGFVLGYSSIAYPAYLGIYAGFRKDDASPYRFDIGVGTEEIYKGYTPEYQISPWAFKVKLGAEKMRVGMSSYGASLEMRTFGEQANGLSISFTTFTAVIFWAWPSKTGLED